MADSIPPGWSSSTTCSYLSTPVRERMIDMIELRKPLLTLFLCCAFTSAGLAQWPDNNIDAEKAVKFKVKQVDILLDSAVEGFKRPFPEVKQFKFDREGLVTHQEHIVSDAHYIHNYYTYEYRDKQLIRLIQIAKPIDAPAFITTDTTIFNYQYENGLLVSKSAIQGDLPLNESTFEYEHGKESLVTRKDRLMGSTTKVSKEYNAQGQLLKELEDYGHPEMNSSVEYRYKDGLLVEKRYLDNTGKPNFTYYYEYDAKGNKIEERRVNGDGELSYTERYSYDKNGLMQHETSYDKEGQFQYRFKTLYTYY